MNTFTLLIEDIEQLKTIRNKLQDRRKLTPNQTSTLVSFLNYLPLSNKLLQMKFPLEKPMEIQLIDIGEIWPHLKKWLDLFNALPKNGNSHYPSAGLIDESNDEEFWLRNVIIQVAFIPSFVHSKKNSSENKLINLCLKTDGSAFFDFHTIEDAKLFIELYEFKGSWKEAYLLLGKTLQQGWPQTKFPKEFEQLLKK